VQPANGNPNQIATVQQPTCRPAPGVWAWESETMGIVIWGSPNVTQPNGQPAPWYHGMGRILNPPIGKLGTEPKECLECGITQCGVKWGGHLLHQWPRGGLGIPGGRGGVAPGNRLTTGNGSQVIGEVGRPRWGNVSQATRNTPGLWVLVQNVQR